MYNIFYIFVRETTKIEVMKKLTQKEVSMYRKETLVAMLYNLQDLACNIDYVKQPLESDIVHSNITLIESKLIHKEF